MTINQKLNPLTSAGFNLVPDVPSEIGAVTNEPTGVIATQFTVDYDSTTRTLTISPVGASFDVYIKGVRIIKTGVQSVVHDSATGEYFFEYDSTGTLTASLTPFNFLERAQIAVVRYNSTQTPAGIRLVETHGVTLDGAAHSILHRTIGTNLISGGTITTGTTVTRAPSDTYNAANSALADIQPGVDATVIADEDIRTSLSAYIEASGYSVLRKRWTTNDYVWLTGETAPYYRSGNVPQYNPSSGGDNLVNMTNTAYVCYYLVCIPAGTEANSQLFRYFWTPGRTQYVPTTASTANRTIARDNALAEDPGSMDLTDFWSTEYVIVHKLVVSYDTGSTGNDYRLRIEGQQSIRGNRARPIVTSGITATNHGSLTGLSDPNSHPATAISAAPVSGQLDPAVETNVELCVDRLSEYGSITAYTAAKTYRIGNLIQIDGYVFKALGNFTASTWAIDSGSCELINVPTVNSSGGLRAVGGSYNKVIRLGSVSGYNKFYEYKTGTVTSRGIPDVDGVGYYDPIDTNFDRFAHVNTFSVGDLVYLKSNGEWDKAKADSSTTIKSLGIVSYVNGNVFHVTYAGIMEFPSAVLTTGLSYWLSDSTAGAYTSTKPTTIGNLECPCFDALSTRLAYIRFERPNVIGATNVSQSANLLNNTASQFIVDLTGITGGFINAIVTVDAATDVRQEFVLLFSKNAVGSTWSISTLSTSGENTLTTFDIDTSGILRATVGNHTTFVSATCLYSINSSALGASFPQVVSASNVIGSTTGVAPAAGVIGETLVQSRLRSAATSLTTTTGTNVTATKLTLTPGNWLIKGNVACEGSSATSTRFSASISKTSATLSGNDTIAVATAGEIRNDILVNLGSNIATLSLDGGFVSINSNTDFYLIVYCVFSAGSVTAYGKIEATRIG